MEFLMMNSQVWKKIIFFFENYLKIPDTKFLMTEFMEFGSLLEFLPMKKKEISQLDLLSM